MMLKHGIFGTPLLLRRQVVWICFLLVMATGAVYWNVQHFDFVHYDDPLYVVDNGFVQSGLTMTGTLWALTATDAANWHPVTWLSHMLDVELFGMEAGWHHITNVCFHIANSLLLFLLLRRATGKTWQSACVATLFALHPLHVESVAWVAERKDVLSTFLWMVTLGAYMAWVKKGGRLRYLATMVFFALGLMAKPMLVTVPFLLLLLDYWPLRRLQGERSEVLGNKKTNWLMLVWEKTPLFILAAISCFITYLVQRKWGAVTPLEASALDIRIANAIVSYIAYLGKTIWPVGLAAFYPHPGLPSIWAMAMSLLLLVVFFVAAVIYRRRFPFLTVGWFWYVGTLVPVIGLVQVGDQSMADRYTYIPLIGVFIAVCWGVPELLHWWSRRKGFLVTLSAIGITILMVLTWTQVQHWRDGETLFAHAVAVTEDNYFAHAALGDAVLKGGRTSEAISHYKKALQIKPDYADGHNKLGGAYFEQGMMREAVARYKEALRFRPHFAEAHYNLGNAFAKQGRSRDALEHYSAAIRLNPRYEEAHYGLGNVLASQGQTKKALVHYAEALRKKPNYAAVHYNMGLLFFSAGNIDEAVDHFRTYLQIKPNDKVAHNNLGYALLRAGDRAGAAQHFQAALDIDPTYERARNNLNRVSKNEIKRP